MKLEDLTDGQLDLYCHTLSVVNLSLEKGLRKFSISCNQDDQVAVLDLVKKKYEDACWQIEINPNEWIFTSTIKDNDPKRSAWIGPSLRPVSQ